MRVCVGVCTCIKRLPFQQHAPSGPTRAQIHSYIFRLARSVDGNNNKQGSIQDVAAEEPTVPDFKESS